MRQNTWSGRRRHCTLYRCASGGLVGLRQWSWILAPGESSRAARCPSCYGCGGGQPPWGRRFKRRSSGTWHTSVDIYCNTITWAFGIFESNSSPGRREDGWSAQQGGGWSVDGKIWWAELSKPVIFDSFANWTNLKIFIHWEIVIAIPAWLLDILPVNHVQKTTCADEPSQEPARGEEDPDGTGATWW